MVAINSSVAEHAAPAPVQPCRDNSAYYVQASRYRSLTLQFHLQLFITVIAA